MGSHFFSGRLVRTPRICLPLWTTFFTTRPGATSSVRRRDARAASKSRRESSSKSLSSSRSEGVGGRRLGSPLPLGPAPAASSTMGSSSSPGLPVERPSSNAGSASMAPFNSTAWPLDIATRPAPPTRASTSAARRGSHRLASGASGKTSHAVGHSEAQRDRRRIPAARVAEKLIVQVLAEPGARSEAE